MFPRPPGFPGARGALATCRPRNVVQAPPAPPRRLELDTLLACPTIDPEHLIAVRPVPRAERLLVLTMKPAYLLPGPSPKAPLG